MSLATAAGPLSRTSSATAPRDIERSVARMILRVTGCVRRLRSGADCMILVIGGGIFGVTAALELRARGHEVTLLEQGRIPNPLAESMDVSKAVRMDYGADE